MIADLHWLIHQGHVIEFANGTLETAKKPAPRPPKPEKEKTRAAEPIEAANISAETSEPGTAGPDVGIPVSAPTEPGMAQHTAPVEAAEFQPPAEEMAPMPDSSLKPQ